MQNPALPETLRRETETKVSKRHPRAEWSTAEVFAWEGGMIDAASLAYAKGNTALAEQITEAMLAGPY